MVFLTIGDLASIHIASSLMAFMVVKSSLANSDDLGGRPHWKHSELVFGEKQVIPALQQLFLACPRVTQ